MVLPPKPPKRTRYFVFTRVNPKLADYILLISEAAKHDFQLTFQTNKTEKKRILLGFLVLRKGQSSLLRLSPMLPNFLVSPLPRQFENGYEWMKSINGVPDGPYYHDHNGHPFEILRNKLNKITV